MRFILVILALPLLAEARVFNYKDSSVAPFIRGTAGSSQVAQDPFANSSGASTVSGTTKYNYGAEIGVVLGLSANLHFRLGAEMIQEQPVNSDGKDSSGTQLYTLKSSIFIFNPNATFEFASSSKGNMRFFGEAGAGYASVAVTNDYKMTSAGTTALGVGDFTENFGTSALSVHAGVGMETLFTDNVTFVADAGYRYLPIKGMKYKSAVNNIVSPGGAASGSSVMNGDGSVRKLNLSGFFVGVGFRFYLNFL